MGGIFSGILSDTLSTADDLILKPLIVKRYDNRYQNTRSGDTIIPRKQIPYTTLKPREETPFVKKSQAQRERKITPTTQTETKTQPRTTTTTNKQPNTAIFQSTTATIKPKSPDKTLPIQRNNTTKTNVETNRLQKPTPIPTTITTKPQYPQYPPRLPVITKPLPVNPPAEISTTKAKEKLYSNDDNKDQLPAYIIKYAVLANLGYSYPTYMFLGLEYYLNVLNMLKDATYVPVNTKVLVNLEPYISNFEYQQIKHSGVLSKASRVLITKKFNKDFSYLIDREKYALSSSGSKADNKDTLHNHQFDINHHTDSINDKTQDFAIIYIHTSDDLSCYIIADASDKDNPEIHIIFRGTRSLKNALTDLKGISKKDICTSPDSETGKKNRKAFAGALELEAEAINTIFYSIVYLYINFLNKKCYGKKAQISVCGHSLGGCLSSIFGYYLAKMLSANWDNHIIGVATKGGGQSVRKTKKNTNRITRNMKSKTKCNKRSKSNTRKRKNSRKQKKKNYSGGNAQNNNSMFYSSIFKRPIIVVAISSPRPFNKELEQDYSKLVKDGLINHINYTSRGDAVTSLPPQSFGMYHPMHSSSIKMGFGKKSNPYDIRSDSINRLNTSNIKGVVTRSNPLSHGMVGGISFMDKILGFKISSDLKGKKACKILMILNQDGDIKNTSHIFPYEDDKKINNYSTFKRLIIDNMHESKVTQHSIDGIQTVGTANNTENIHIINDIANDAHDILNTMQNVVCR